MATAQVEKTLADSADPVRPARAPERGPGAYGRESPCCLSMIEYLCGKGTRVLACSRLGGPRDGFDDKMGVLLQPLPPSRDPQDREEEIEEEEIVEAAEVDVQA